MAIFILILLLMPRGLFGRSKHDNIDNHTTEFNTPKLVEGDPAGLGPHTACLSFLIIILAALLHWW